jgi:shikimate dehydrogenase
MGAVNTIYLQNGETYGENTDGKGFLTSLIEAGIKLEDQKIVMFGAGGAARAMTIELANVGVAHITVVNRGEERGEELVKLLNSKTSAKAEFIKWDNTFSIPKDINIVVNATSIGMYPDQNKPDIDYTTLLKSMIVCDGVHNPAYTPFLIEAERNGCRILDGLSMLINQGAISFKLWTGCDPPIDIMKEALKKEFDLNK